MIAGLLGLGFGSGLLLLYFGLRPRPEPLALALARLEPRTPGPSTTREGDTETWDIRFGAVALRRVGLLRRAADRARRDLRIVRRSPEEQATRTLLFAGFGCFLGPWLGVVTWLVGNPFPPIVLGVVALVGAGIGIGAPWTSIRETAKRRRRDFLMALAVWCDLVSRCLASGRGVDESVTTAAREGSGWAFGELRAALGGGSVRGQTAWASLDRLGTELGVEDLQELAATISMAGEEGAAVRDAVAVKARTIRERITAETERTAESATAQMPMPIVMVGFGMLVFLAYPALVALSRSGF